MVEELDYSKLKYVLYARKSTDDPQRQVRSISDQIFECKQLVGVERIELSISATRTQRDADSLHPDGLELYSSKW